MTIEIRRRESRASLDCPDLHPVLVRIYRARGIGSIDELKLDLDRLVPVGSLDCVQAAAELLFAHRAKGRGLIVGDFDADGATSTALMVRALRACGFAHVDFVVPDRFRFGYGLTPRIVEAAIERRPTLIVTVDNGVASIEGVALARKSGMDVLVTDHHLPGRELPAASVIVNPNLPASGFASRCLAGVGVAFYVIAALSRLLPGSSNPAQWLDLVALGTVADLVPLDRNNRVLVHQGLIRIRAGRCVPGIRALIEVAGRRQSATTAADLGFSVAPRLNAAGRLTDMRLGIDCLLAESPGDAARLAEQLSELNARRRDIEARMQEEAVRIATSFLSGSDGKPRAAGLCLFDPGWHPGVVGLVAGRLKHRLHRPVIALAPEQAGTLRGSARSVEGVHIRDVLDVVATAHPGLLDKFGGHAMAAGVSLASGNLEAFAAAFDQAVRQAAGGEALGAMRHSDGELAPTEISLETARALRDGGPWGQGFAEPQFDGEFDLLETRLVGERHLKMRLRAVTGGATMDAIHFGYLGSEFDDPRVRAGTRVRLLYRLEVNDYAGTERLQINSSCLMPA